jgi:hypothetical protein
MSIYEFGMLSSIFQFKARRGDDERNMKITPVTESTHLLFMLFIFPWIN